MTAPTDRETPPGGTPPFGTPPYGTPPYGSPLNPRGMSVKKSLAVAVLGAIGAILLTFFVLRNEYGVGVEVLLATSALAAFGIAAYGLVQTVLAIVDSAGERRRQERTVSERRTGERARQPRH